MKFAQIIGWILLVAGLILIIWTLFSSYNIFTGKSEFSSLFNVGKEDIPVESDLNEKVSRESMEDLEQMTIQQLLESIPLDTLPRLINLVVWSTLAFILIFGGGQISKIGVRMIKADNH